MNTINNLQDKILNVNSENFLARALEVFEFQSKTNSVYAAYLKLLNKQNLKPIALEDIPFLPTEIFKHKMIKSGDWKEEIIFESSGTTQAIKSRHWYHQMCKICFEYHYGSINQYQFIGLMPSAKEKPNSSLVSMVQSFTKISNASNSLDTLLNDHKAIYELLSSDNYWNKKVILFGLSLSLLDFVRHYVVDHPDLIVIETGGMKSSNRKTDKESLLAALKIGFPKASIHSEYGMTELMSQAYAKDSKLYSSPPVLKFLISDPTDPTVFLSQGSRGIINLIDLGNINTCSFIQTGDLGILHENERLEVLGRFNPEETRGCVQMIEEKLL
jgi:hypothetical protein